MAVVERVNRIETALKPGWCLTVNDASPTNKVILEPKQDKKHQWFAFVRDPNNKKMEDGYLLCLLPHLTTRLRFSATCSSQSSVTHPGCDQVTFVTSEKGEISEKDPIKVDFTREELFSREVEVDPSTGKKMYRIKCLKNGHYLHVDDNPSYGQTPVIGWTKEDSNNQRWMFERER